MADQAELRVRGLVQLNRAFARAGKQTRREVRLELAHVAEPVRRAAEALAVAEISHIGPDWSVMRTGVTSRSVYVAPRERGAKGRGRESARRPNLGNLLMDKAMEPALQQNRAQIEASFDEMLTRISSDWASDSFLEIDPSFRG